MSVPFQKDCFFCLFGKIWIKMPPLSSGIKVCLVSRLPVDRFIGTNDNRRLNLAAQRIAAHLAKFSDGGGVSICHYCGRAGLLFTHRCVFTACRDPCRLPRTGRKQRNCLRAAASETT